jgi:hypothetical protein
MAGPSIDQLFADTGVVKKLSRLPVTTTATHNPTSSQNVLTVPTYRDHLSTLADNRISQTSQELLKSMFKHDPDASATVGSYLTLADTELTMVVRDAGGQIDIAASKQLPALVKALTMPTNYLNGFQLKTGMALLLQEMRYMVMLRGAIGNELVFDKKLVPTRLQHVDMASVQWFEKSSGEYKPSQRVAGKNDLVSLDFPSFFVSYHRRDPTSIYGTSDFVSVINTAAARTQVVNDLYRIMTITGFPRMDITVLEEVMEANMPVSIKDAADPNIRRQWVAEQMSAISSTFANLRADQSFVHTDSVEAKILNDKNPGAALDIGNVIDVLNAQNQAALKTMSTVIGRGQGGAGVASVEARLAAMNADQLNVPVKAQLDQALTFLINVYGIQGFVDCTFAPAELRPRLELEAQMSLKASRMLNDLSLGIITDEEYHLALYKRLPPEGSEELSGTGFMAAAEGAVDASDVTPNDDPMGRSLTGEGAKAAKGNGKVGSKKPAKTKPK